MNDPNSHTVSERKKVRVMNAAEKRTIEQINAWGIFLDDDVLGNTMSCYKVVKRGAYRFKTPLTSVASDGNPAHWALVCLSPSHLREKLAPELAASVMRGLEAMEARTQSYKEFNLGLLNRDERYDAPRYHLCDVNDVLVDMYVTICQSCNLSMGSCDMEEYQQTHGIM